MITVADAIKSLDDSSEFTIVENKVNWITPPIDETLITAEIQRLQAEYDSLQYARNRATEYPPIEDYLDGIVKGDQAQVDKYIADCQAVKNKYPKELN